MDKTSLGDRIKGYEQVWKIKFPNRMPLILRLDGKAFHTFTKGLKSPFDLNFIELMSNTAKYLCENIQGSQVAFVQSDEITILINDYKKLNSSGWFDRSLQKIDSISAGMASAFFSINSNNLNLGSGQLAVFDCRAFVLPEKEVNNNFVWRQQDWKRNSIQMLAQSMFSHKEMHKKNVKVLRTMCEDKRVMWENLPTHLKRGTCIIKEYFKKDEATRSRWILDKEIPIFSKNANYIEKFLEVDE